MIPPEAIAALASLPSLSVAAVVGVVGWRATRNGKTAELPPGIVADISEIKHHMAKQTDQVNKMCVILDERLPKASYFRGDGKS